MKKAILVLLTVLLLASSMSGCSRDYERHDYERFKKVEQYKDLNVYVDTDTGIAYGMLYDQTNSRVMFPLYDKDGNLYRPNGWRDYSDGDDLY